MHGVHHRAGRRPIARNGGPPCKRQDALSHARTYAYMSHGPMGSLGSLGLPERFRDLCRVVVRRVVVRVAVAFLKRKKIFLFKRQQLPEQLPGSEIHFSLRKASIFGILVDLLAGTCAGLVVGQASFFREREVPELR